MYVEAGSWFSHLFGFPEAGLSRLAIHEKLEVVDKTYLLSKVPHPCKIAAAMCF